MPRGLANGLHGCASQWAYPTATLLGAIVAAGAVPMLMQKRGWPAWIVVLYGVCVVVLGLTQFGWALFGSRAGLQGDPRLDWSYHPMWVNWVTMPTWMRRTAVFVGVPCVWLGIDVVVCAIPAHRFVTLLLRTMFRVGLGMAALAMVWTIGWGDRRAWQWIDGDRGWTAPAIGFGLIAVLLLFVATMRVNPRRVRRRSYPDRPGRMPCPKCGRRMTLQHRHAECRRCPHSEMLPREWWVCECGQPLRGVSGDRCPECGCGPDSYNVFGRARPAPPPRQKSLLDTEWTLDDIVDREG